MSNKISITNAEITISEKEKIVFEFSLKNYNGTYEKTKDICGQINKLIACEALGDGEYTGTVVFSEVKPDGSEEYIDSDEFSVTVDNSLTKYEF